MFVLLCWPEGRRSRVTRRLVQTAWIAAFVGAVASILIGASYTAGLGFADSFKWSVVHDFVDTHVGNVLVVRVVLFALAAALRPVLVRRDAPRGSTKALTALAGVALLATFTFAGHARTGIQIPWAVVADLAHVSAFSLWFGGLAVLLVAVVRPEDPSELEPAVPRFSRLALVLVTVLVGTGTYQAWRQTGSIASLKETTYGRLLLVKIALVAVAVVAAAVRAATSCAAASVTRREGNAHTGGEDEPESLSAGPGATALERPARRRRRDGAPVARERRGRSRLSRPRALRDRVARERRARRARALNAPFERNLQAVNGSLQFEVLVAPARSGPNDLHIERVRGERHARAHPRARRRAERTVEEHRADRRAHGPPRSRSLHLERARHSVLRYVAPADQGARHTDRRGEREPQDPRPRVRARRHARVGAFRALRACSGRSLRSARR